MEFQFPKPKKSTTPGSGRTANDELVTADSGSWPIVIRFGHASESNTLFSVGKLTSNSCLTARVQGSEWRN